MTTISTRSILESLTKARLTEIGCSFNLDLPADAIKDVLATRLTAAPAFEPYQVLDLLLRDELKAICHAHGLDDAGRARTELVNRLLQAWKPGASIPSPPASPQVRDLTAPKAGDIVHVRHRQYLVEELVPRPRYGEHTVVRLVYLDDDAQGRRLGVLWERELGARMPTPEAHGLGMVDRIDLPRALAAYLHALTWSCGAALRDAGHGRGEAGDRGVRGRGDRPAVRAQRAAGRGGAARRGREGAKQKGKGAKGAAKAGMKKPVEGGEQLGLLGEEDA